MHMLYYNRQRKLFFFLNKLFIPGIAACNLFPPKVRDSVCPGLPVSRIGITMQCVCSLAKNLYRQISASKEIVPLYKVPCHIMSRRTIHTAGNIMPWHAWLSGPVQVI